MQSQKKYPKVFSVEFFPPKTEQGFRKLSDTRAKLAELQPRFFSVTYGAGGSTRDRTLNAVLDIQRSGHEAAPHISCVNSTRDQVQEVLQRYQAAGIRRLVALRGDLPSGERGYGEFKYANELVAFVRECTGDHFFIEVAAYPEFHPQAPSPQADLTNFKRKVDAGANGAITQYFFNADAYFHFVKQCAAAGIDIPIVPGVMPINNFNGLVRFSDMCGAEIPRWIRKTLQQYGDDEQSVRAFGIEVVSRLCQQLLDAGAPGLHFYSMNQAEPTFEIWSNLSIED